MAINEYAINEVEINGDSDASDNIGDVENIVKTTFSLQASIENIVKTTFSLTKNVENIVKTTFSLLSLNFAENIVKTTFSLLSSASQSSVILDLDATITLNGVQVDINSANISQDEDSWTWGFNATVSDHGNWDTVRPSNGNYPDIVLTVRGVVFNLMIEGMQRSRKDVTSNWAINGRGITARLDGKYAAGVDTAWREVNAQTIIQELCTAANITLDYLAVDWQIKELDGQGRYPIEIINEIASAIGAVVQTTTLGVLTIRPRYPIKPADYATATPDFTITDTDDYITLDEQWIDRDNYNVISIGDSETDSDDNQQLSITSEDDLDSEGEKQSDNKIIKIYSVPFISSISLDDSAEGALGLIYQGIMTETIELEAVEIVQGAGSLSLPMYGNIVADYIHTDLGQLTIKENGEISAAIEGQSLINLSYTTKYHQYIASRNSADKFLQIFAEVEE